MEKNKIIETLTEKEKPVLESIIKGLYAEYGFTDIDIKDVTRDTKIDSKIARGVIGSLVKKGIIDVYEHESNFMKQEFYILNDNFLFLHPRWEKEKEYEDSFKKK